MDLELDMMDSGGMLRYYNMRDLFMNCYNMQSVNFPMQYVPNIDKDKHLERLFYACRELSKIDNFMISQYDTTKGALHLEEAFYTCSKLEKGPTYIRSTEDMYISKAFYGCSALKEMPKLDCMYGDMIMDEAFAMCISITKLGPIYFSISNKPSKNIKINMRRMFYNCVNLEDVVSNGHITFSLADVNMTSTFDGCISLESTPTIELKTKAKLDLIDTYAGAKKLKVANKIFGQGIIELNMERTYKDCKALNTTFQIDIDGRAVIKMNNTFEGCTSLKTLYDLFSKAKPGNDVVYYLKETFKDCTSLVDLVIDASNIYSVDGIFTGCTALESVTFVNPNSTIESKLTHKVLDGNSLYYRISTYNR